MFSTTLATGDWVASTARDAFWCEYAETTKVITR